MPPPSGPATGGAEAPHPYHGRVLPLPAALLWDMDGTLIDTEPYWMAAETELVEAHGGTWTHVDAVRMIGSSMAVCAAELQARGVELGVAEIADALNGRVGAAVAAGIPWKAGALELLTELRAAGVPQALVTSSQAVLALPFADAVGVFDVVVAGDHVTHSKPHPEPYLTAARLLGFDPAQCVAVEDSPSGVAAALASGARVVALASPSSVPTTPELSRVSGLTDLDLPTLARVGAGHVLDLRAA